METEYDAVVIGSGAGGLGAALSLARAGQQVLVVEQHDRPGGWLHSFTIEGHRFDTGVHYIGELGPGGFSRLILEGLGIGGRLVFSEMNPDGYDRVTIGDREIRFPKGLEDLKDRFADEFAGDAVGIRRFLERCAEVRKTAGEFRHAADRTDLWRRLSRSPVRAAQGVAPLNAHLKRDVNDEHARAALSAQHAYYALAPDRVPFVVHAAVTGHYFDGGWYPLGGGRAIALALTSGLRSAGGELRVRARVRRIVTDGTRVTGVEMADGKRVRASTVISNADPGVTFNHLLDKSHVSRRRRNRLARKRWSSSCLSLFMAGSFDAREYGLDSGNVVHLSDPNVGKAYAPDVLAGPGPFPYLFLTVASLKDPTAIRTDNRHTLEAFIPAPWDWFSRWEGTETEQRPSAYDTEKQRLVERILTTVELAVPGLRDRIDLAELGTPLTNNHYVAGTRGSMYGIEKALFNVGPFAQQVTTDVDGLWLCGDSTIAHGVIGSLFSGVVAAASVLETTWEDLLESDPENPIRTVPADRPEEWPADLKKSLKESSPS